MSVNRVHLIGRLGKDPELTYTQNGTAKCRFSLATSEVYFDHNQTKVEKTDWHNIVVWGKQAESAGKYLQKGREVYIEGKIENRSWDDEKTGQKRYITEIKAQRVVFIGGGGQKRDDGDDVQRRNRGGNDRDADDHGGNGGCDEGPGDQAGGPPPDDDIPF